MGVEVRVMLGSFSSSSELEGGRTLRTLPGAVVATAAAVAAGKNAEFPRAKAARLKCKPMAKM